MRGKVSIQPVDSVEKRITPACAGKSVASTWGNALTRDHPRVCGEKLIQTAAGLAAWGSPPRVRGKEAYGNSVNPYQGSPPRVRGKESALRPASGSKGITPACAGKSRTEYKQALDEKDHPRVCGEKMDKPA